MTKMEICNRAVDLESQISNVGRPGSPDSPGNPGFRVAFRLGSADSFAGLSGTTLARSANLKPLASPFLASAAVELDRAAIDPSQNCQFYGISAMEGR
jgi:hypothetical protein